MQRSADNSKLCLERESAHCCLASSLLANLQSCVLFFNLHINVVIKRFTEKNLNGARIKIDATAAHTKSVMLAQFAANGFDKSFKGVPDHADKEQNKAKKDPQNNGNRLDT